VAGDPNNAFEFHPMSSRYLLEHRAFERLLNRHLYWSIAGWSIAGALIGWEIARWLIP
jgi:hypothetical protein